jgi:catechol 2,3-dioxygenase-like lactoylglutathione lyase family enzyme
MLAHVTIRVSERAESERFYRTVLTVLGIEPTHDTPELIAWDDFALIAADADHPPTRDLHLGFVAASRGAVDAFWRRSSTSCPGVRIARAGSWIRSGTCGRWATERRCSAIRPEGPGGPLPVGPPVPRRDPRAPGSLGRPGASAARDQAARHQGGG